MARHDLIVIGGSAGAVETIPVILRGLAADLPCAILITVHTGRASTLPRVFDRASPLPCAHAADGEAIEPGKVLIAPPDYHLLVHKGHVRLSHGPRVNLVRPSIDELFRSAARAYGPRVVGVLVSGALDDGSVGMAVIKRHGGITIAQDPDEAVTQAMPANAIATGAVDYIASASEIAELLNEIVKEPISGEQLVEERGTSVPSSNGGETAIQREGDASGLTCPECSGALWESEDSGVVMFRCRVGHSYSEESMVEAQGDSVEAALWAAIRALEERSELLGRMARRAEEGRRLRSAELFREGSASVMHKAEVLRDLLDERTQELDDDVVADA
jgi:two-component system chemotaxis response regulator CheB